MAALNCGPLPNDGLFDRHRAIVIATAHEDDAECNLELLQEHKGGTTLSIDEVEQQMVEQNKRAQVEGFGLLGIRRRNEKRPIGYCGLIIGRCSFDEPEIAYEILPQFRGKATQQRPLAL